MIGYTDPHVMITLGVLVLAVVSYTQERIPLDLVSLGLLAILVCAFQLVPLEVPGEPGNRLSAARMVQGFANPALITVVALFVVGEGITRTGALEAVAAGIKKVSAGNWRLALTLTLVVVAGASAFLNNTPIVIIFMPILAALANDFGLSPSKFLMPLSFASILGGTCTLIGTSTNILVADFAQKSGAVELEMFSFSQLGLLLLATGLVYLVLIAPSLLADRRGRAEGAKESGGRGREFTAQLQVLPDSPLVGTVLSVKLEKVVATQMLRGEKSFWPPFAGVKLEVGDVVIVVGAPQNLKKLEWNARSSLTPVLPGNPPKDPAKRAEETLAEVVITHASPYVGRTLSRIRFRDRFGPAVIAIQRHSRQIRGRITETPLKPGDLLLIQGKARQIDRLSDRHEVLLLWGAGDDVVLSAKAPMAAAILFGVVAGAALHIADMLTLSLAGAFLMLATRCLSLRLAYAAINPQVVLLIAATLGLGLAMQETGSAQLLAQSLLDVTHGAPPWVIMALFGLLVTLLTNIISNNATAILFAPIALGLAQGLGTSPLPFLMAVVFGANAAFSSPIGYQTNLLVMSAGEYSFKDFLKAGLPLNLMAWAMVSVLIPWFWPF